MHLRDGIQTHATVIQRYDHLVAAGEIRADAAQVVVAKALDRVLVDVIDNRLAKKSSALGWLFARRRETREPVRGLYVHGGVGRGKTMLMDMFFELVPVRRKRRAHFNDFMTDVHDRIARHRQARADGTVKEDDPIPVVARALAEQAWVLCFDEFTVTDIADAMILSRLFSALFAEGVVLVATSNVAPQDLYKDGLNRSLFLPFISMLEKHAVILNLDSDTDYRMQKLGRFGVYFEPLGEAAEQAMNGVWRDISEGKAVLSESIAIKGRKVDVPRASGRSARFTFSQLCEEPLAAREYLAIADRYDTVLIDRVPILDPTLRNPTKRFILLIDTFYDRRLRVVISADAPPAALYAGRAGVTEAFEFDRTVSRLIEMQSKEWLDDWHERHSDDHDAAEPAPQAQRS